MYAVVADASPPLFGLLVRVLDVFVLAELPVFSGFPQPAGGFEIVVGADGGCADRAGTTGFPQPVGALVTPFDVETDTVDADEGFPHPGGAFVTPTFDVDFAFGVGTSLALKVFVAGAGFGGGAYGLLYCSSS